MKVKWKVGLYSNILKLVFHKWIQKQEETEKLSE